MSNDKPQKSKVNSSAFSDSPSLIFTKFLVQIRKWHRDNKKKLFIVSSILIASFTLIAFLLDAFLPFGPWWNIIRTLAMIPLGGSMFILGYGLSIDQHLKRIFESNESGVEWIPFRTRFSPSTRLRISAIILAFLAVIVFATTNTISFTFASSVFFAIIISLLAFIRKTRDELERDELGIPDGRDLIASNKIKDAEEEREVKALARKIKKEKKRDKRVNILNINKKSSGN